MQKRSISAVLIINRRSQTIATVQLLRMPDARTFPGANAVPEHVTRTCAVTRLSSGLVIGLV